MRKALVMIAMICIMLVGTGCLRVVEDGEVGVKKTLGEYRDDELNTGVHLFMPVISMINVVNTKTTTIEEPVSVPSKEGLIVDLDISVIYKIKADQASEIKQTVSGDVKDTLLVPYIRNGIRDIVSGYEAKAVYSEESRGQIADKLEEQLKSKLSEKIIIEDVLLRDVRLPDSVRASIEAKINAEQVAEKKEFELQAAEMDAEIDVARAKGTSESNKIIAGSLSAEYLQWRFIEMLSKTSNQVIYVATEANMPITEATRFAPSANSGALVS